MVILRILEKVLINTLLILLLVGGYKEARGEEALFPLINGLFRRYLEIPFSYHPQKVRKTVTTSFLINENSEKYFRRLIKMDINSLKKEAQNLNIPLPNNFTREHLISLLIYHSLPSSPNTSIFWDYNQVFPQRNPTEFGRAVGGYKKENKFIVVVDEMGNKRKITRLLPIAVDKNSKRWSLNDIEEYGDHLKFAVVELNKSLMLKINDTGYRVFKGWKVNIYELTEDLEIREFSYFWYVPGYGIIKSGGKGMGEVVLIEYFRPDLRKGWKIKLPSKIIESLYSFGEESLNKKIQEEVEKAWEEKGFKVFYQQEWPEEQTQK